MNKQSENKTTPGQNKVKPAKDEISEQDLNKVSGGLNIGSQGGGSGAGKITSIDGGKNPFGPIDG